MLGVPASNLGRRVGVRRFFERHVADHVAAALPRRQDFVQLFLDEDGADAGRAENLVAGEDEEIGAHLLHVDRHVGDRLGAVDDDARAVALGHLRHFLDRQDRAQAVRRLRQRDDLRARAEHLLVLFQHDLAVIVDGNDAEHGAFVLGDHLPGNDLGVVLEHREHDFVARLQELAAVGVGDRG